MLEDSTLLYKFVVDKFDQISDLISMDDSIKTILSQPKNELMVNFPVKLDNGEYKMFKGYRIQHRTLIFLKALAQLPSIPSKEIWMSPS